jgi:hypothetical protein
MYPINRAQISRMFDLSNYVVEHVGDEEKRKYEGHMRETGTYRGYKPRKFWVSDISQCERTKAEPTIAHHGRGQRPNRAI